MKPNDLQSKVLAAIGKKLGESAESPAAGKHQGEFLCRVTYEMNKGVDYETAPTVSLLSKAVLAKALVMSGIQADNFLVNLLKVAKEALDADEKVGPAMSEADTRVLTQMDALFSGVIAQLPRQPRSGSFTGSVSVEVLNANQRF